MTPSGRYLFTNQAGSTELEASPQDGHVACFLCCDELPSKKMRDHIAHHILMKVEGKRQSLKIPVCLHGSDSCLTNINVPQIGNNPCGFCGRSSTCSVGLKKTKRTWMPISDCPYSVKFALGPAAKSTTSGPSTNQPIQCCLCVERL
jgi:hypothetical protein